MSVVSTIFAAIEALIVTKLLFAIPDESVELSV
jgi:hypothetical protein